MSLIDTLIEKKLLTPEKANAIQEEVTKTGASMREIIVRHGVDQDALLKIQGEVLNIPTQHIGDREVKFEVLKYIPEESALHYQFVPIGVKDGVLEVGIVDPNNAEARDVLNFISSKNNIPFKIFLITEDDFNNVLKTYKGLSGEVTKALSELETEVAAEEEEEEIADGEVDKDGVRIIEDAPVTKIVATILHYAVEGGASDIHIEHMGDTIRVRFRVDGVLHISLMLPAKVHRAVVARIKILSSMRLDEKRKPQDGRFSAKILGRKIDFRVSTFPAYYGEKIVMRILDSEKGVRKLDDMGLSERNLKIIKAALKKPYGMVLISGPTGSGKSSTLYSMLQEVDKEKHNVLSLEDPVEYNMTGMNQSQVHPEIGYTFASGLRTTLRQDPDVIMVGEIRDKETAKLAVQAALTGHLVFSTIHTNNAAGVIPRLINMGVDPFLIAPTLVLAIAQRLVKTLCPGGGEEVTLEESMQAMLDKQFSDLPEEYKKHIPESKAVFKASPTPECPNGTRGRTAVMEVFEMTKELEHIILTNPTDLEITKTLRKNGMFTLKEDALIKSMERTVPFEEVNKL